MNHDRWFVITPLAERSRLDSHTKHVQIPLISLYRGANPQWSLNEQLSPQLSSNHYS